MFRQTGRKKLGIGRRTFHRTITEMNVWAETLLSETRIHHGRGTGVRRGRGVGLSRGGAVAVAVAVAVGVAVGVGEGVGVGVGLGAAAQYLPAGVKNGGKERPAP